MRNQIVGKIGEKRASEYLTQLGYTVVAENYKAKEGEIDLIAKNDSEIVFVEVKMRTSNLFGVAKESLPEKRIKRLFSASQMFISENKFFENFVQKFFLVAIDNDRIEMIPVDLM
ncbi:MAG: YraN family protein [Caldisericia bacterium]